MCRLAGAPALQALLLVKAVFLAGVNASPPFFPTWPHIAAIDAGEGTPQGWQRGQLLTVAAARRDA
jgi:hypothetical protein